MLRMGNLYRRENLKSRKETVVRKLVSVTVTLVKLSLCVTKHHAMKIYFGVQVQLHAFLTSALSQISCVANAICRQ